MKVDFYIDAFQGTEPRYLTATANPIEKSPASKRYLVTVDIPNSAFLGEVDEALDAENVEEVEL